MAKCFQLRLIFLVLVVFSTGTACGFDPRLDRIFPRGAQLGQEVVVNFYGQRLQKPSEVLFYKKGIRVSKIEKKNDKHLKITFQIAKDAPLGEHALRLRCEDGVTYQRTFWIGPYPCVEEKEPNTTPKEAQEIQLNQTLCGISEPEDVDYFSLKARKGQRLSLEIEAMRLGGAFFDPHLSVLDENGREVASSDDSPLLKQDSHLSLLIPKDGTYLISVRESAYEGGKQSHYRLHVGDFPRPSAILPVTVRPGQKTPFRVLGDPKGVYTYQVTPHGKAGEKIPLFALRNQISPPSPNYIRLSNHPVITEAEPNNKPQYEAPPKAHQPPCVIQGVIGKAGDEDWFPIQMKKGQAFQVTTHARTLGSPLDSEVVLRDPDKKDYTSSDDQGNEGVPDSSLELKANKDGIYYVQIRDFLRRGGEDYFYSIEIAPKQAKLSASIARADRRDSQKRKVLCIPRGGRYAALVNITRQNQKGDCQVAALSLPKGVTMETTATGKGKNNFLAVFSADKSAPLGGGLHEILLKDSSAKTLLQGHLEEVIEQVYHNQHGVYHGVTSKRHAIAVIEEAPFTIQLEKPGIPIVRNGTQRLKVKIKRAKDFTSSVKLTLPLKPNGIAAPNEVVIPKDKSEATYELNAKGDAGLGQHQLCVSAEASTKNGNVLLASNLITLSVEEPYLTASIDSAGTTPGQDVEVRCNIEHLRPISNGTKVKLHGLPHGVTTVDQSVNPGQKQIIFRLKVAEDAAKGNHSSLFCEFFPKKNGKIIIHRTGQGGALRINPPSKKKVVKKESDPKAPKTTKALSRLEQLRQNQD